MQGSDKPFIQIIHPRLAFERQLEAARANRFGDMEATIAIEGKKRIPHLNVRLMIQLTQLLHFSGHILDAALPKACRNTMRTVGAMLRAATTGQHRDSPRQSYAPVVRVTKSFAFHNIPPRERQRVEVVDSEALH